jgi:hypothetical protein
MFDKQLLHLVLLLTLLAGIVSLVSDDALAGFYIGLGSDSWLVIAIATPILHQYYVWLCWRLELYHGWISKTLGPRGFNFYCIGFTLLFVSRLVTICLLAVSNRGTLDVEPNAAYLLGIVLLIPALYLFYSVRRYFGFKRAYGIDHFDRSYASMPFVRQGIFKWTPNAMYVFGFFVLWVPGLWAMSEAALLAAAFNHLYIWVHYLCTEKPDMQRIYNSVAQ